jgi:uncharacterized protein (TIGR02996 family)
MDLVEPFLDSIRESPDDLTLWLILGDWLEEQQDPRAELVRLTLSLRTEPDHADFDARQRRVQALLRGGMRPLAPTFTNSLGMTLALIPAGSFTMGSPVAEPDRERDEHPPRRVRLKRPFFLGVTAVTQRQYRKLVGSNPATFKQRLKDKADYPVESVAHDAAVRFCQLLCERKEEKAAGRVYRLPTEAEWEYACRAGTTTAYHFGDEAAWSDANMAVGHVAEHPEWSARGQTCPVASYPPNAWGLYDLHGNVWEWCADWFASYARARKVDPPGPETGDFRVIRGGSFNSYPRWCRSARRSNQHAHSTDDDIGFRVACDVTT